MKRSLDMAVFECVAWQFDIHHKGCSDCCYKNGEMNSILEPHGSMICEMIIQIEKSEQQLLHMGVVLGKSVWNAGLGHELTDFLQDSLKGSVFA